MTGYGTGQAADTQREVKSTIRSVNSKYFDCSCRLPNILEPYELKIRELIKKHLQRGSISLQVQYTHKHSQDTQDLVLNEALAQQYWQALETLSSRLKVDIKAETKYTSMVRMPALFSFHKKTHEDEQILWTLAQKSTLQALKDCEHMQATEGECTTQVIQEHLQVFHEKIIQITTLEAHRNQRTEERCRQRAQQYLKEHYDETRLTQELFYYIERHAFDEEKQRLAQHVSFFEETMHQKNLIHAKQLIFITQEISRELNTLGTKSLDADIQRVIVELKTTLEKIKEELHNLQ